jgi:L-fucose isomerase-like protein
MVKNRREPATPSGSVVGTGPFGVASGPLGPVPVVGLACVARPTFAVDYAAQAAEKARAALLATGWLVAGDATLLMDAQAARDAAQALQTDAPDVLVILCATFCDAGMAVELAAEVDVPVCLWALREPGPPGDRLWLNSLCGAHIAAHALKREGRVVRYIYGDPGEEGILAPLEALARAAVVRNRLRRSRIGLVGQAPAGFYGCQYDELALARTIGTTVSQIDLAGIFAVAAEADEPEIAAAIASTKERSPSLATLPEPEVRRFGQAYVVLRDALRERQLDGLAVRCWPEFPQQFGLMPCATLGRLADDGFVCACEADMHGAVTLLLLQWLSGAAPLLADLVAMDPSENTLTLWHCGNAPACLAREGAEPVLTTHCNRRIGVAGNFAIRSGPATVARLSYGPDGYRLFFVEGELLDTPENRFQGNTAVFRPQDSAPDLLDGIIIGGLEHHVAVVAGHLASESRALSEILGIGTMVGGPHPLTPSPLR